MANTNQKELTKDSPTRSVLKAISWRLIASGATFIISFVIFRQYTEKTYSEAQAYLEEANEWYIRSKEYSTQEVKAYKEQLQKDIEDAQTYLKKKDKEARNKISDILQKASELIKKD